ncbi:MAG: hypothetical protein DRQ59_03400 [Gammaproteobacteria bacterium]|nr:MAG: hypothetical protein DRQ59_03400 [Gammaproteobacteria bacterium]
MRVYSHVTDLIEVHIQTRRVFRLGTVPALTLAIAYAIQLPLPFLAPLFAFMFAATPGPPMGIKSLFGLVLVILISLGLGLLLIPLLLHYQFSALLLVALGLYFSSYLTVNMGKALFGTFLTIGFTLISAAGTVSFDLATMVIQSLALAIVVAVFCHWMIYPWFPEDPSPASKKPAETSTPDQSNWIALRSTAIVLPVYWLVLTNPAAYMAIVMKAVLLSQQSSVIDAKSAGRELLGSTFLGGIFAVLFWVLLGISTNLWMFFLWMLLFCLYFAAKIYQLIATRFPASYWLNVAMTMLIILGPGVEDSAGGNDVYAAFLSRMGLFVLVTLYAWFAVYFMEHLRTQRRLKQIVSQN